MPEKKILNPSSGGMGIPDAGQTDLTAKAVNRSPCSPSYILLTFHQLLCLEEWPTVSSFVPLQCP